MAELCLFGAGEHAAVVRDALGDAWRLAGCWGDDRGRGLPLLGDDAALDAAWTRWSACAFHLAFVGTPGAGHRQTALERWQARGARWAAIVHPRAIVSPSARIGDGAFIGPGAVVNAGADIGAHAVINSGAIIEHDVSIGIGTHVAPAAAIGGRARIGAWGWIGLGCRVRDHVAIGDGTIVAMGAAVVADIAAGATVAGVPARPLARRIP